MPTAIPRESTVTRMEFNAVVLETDKLVPPAHVEPTTAAGYVDLNLELGCGQPGGQGSEPRPRLHG